MNAKKLFLVLAAFAFCTANAQTFVAVNESRPLIYYDFDADGTVDRITAWFESSVNLHQMRFRIKFADMTFEEINSEFHPFADGILQNLIVAEGREGNIVTIPFRGAPENLTSGLCTLFIEYIGHLEEDPETGGLTAVRRKFSVADRAAPVVASARYVELQGGGDDTLVVLMSEQVSFTGDNPFVWFRQDTQDGADIYLRQIGAAQAGGLFEATFVLEDGDLPIQNGDSLFIRHDINAISDEENNFQRIAQNVRRPIRAQRYNSIAGAWYLEDKEAGVSRDGYINKIRVNTVAEISDPVIIDKLKTALTNRDFAIFTICQERNFTVTDVSAASWQTNAGRQFGFDIIVEQARSDASGNRIRPNTATSASDVLALHETLNSAPQDLLWLLATDGDVQIQDSIAPVLTDAFLRMSFEDTTFTVEFSEEVSLSAGNPYQFFDASGNEIFNKSLSVSPVEIAHGQSLRYLYRVWEMDKSLPTHEDSVRVSDIQGRVSDLVGNAQKEPTVWAQLTVTDTRVIEIGEVNADAFAVSVFGGGKISGGTASQVFRPIASMGGGSVPALVADVLTSRGTVIVVDPGFSMNPQANEIESVKATIFNRNATLITQTDVRGQNAQVAAVVSGLGSVPQQQRNALTIFWNNKNTNDRTVSSGTYMVILDIVYRGGLSTRNTLNVPVAEQAASIFAQSVVADKMEIILDYPQISFAVFDMAGNLVATDGSSAGDRDGRATVAPCPYNAANRRTAAVSWDLRNMAGRFVANGTYLVIVEAKDENGNSRRFSGKIGVKR